MQHLNLKKKHNWKQSLQINTYSDNTWWIEHNETIIWQDNEIEKLSDIDKYYLE